MQITIDDFDADSFIFAIEDCLAKSHMSKIRRRVLKDAKEQAEKQKIEKQAFYMFGRPHTIPLLKAA